MISKLLHVERNVYSGQCKGALLRVQIGYTAIFLFPRALIGWSGSHLGIFSPIKRNGKYLRKGFYIKLWLAPDVAYSRLPKWYTSIAKKLRFSNDKEKYN